MRLQLRDLYHRTEGYLITFSNLIDNRDFFWNMEKSRDRYYCTYEAYDEYDNLGYIGNGLFWDYREYGYTAFYESRPFTHADDMLSDYLNSEWTLSITSAGLTKLEAELLECHFILDALDEGYELSSYGTRIWDRDKLMNKNRGQITQYHKLKRYFLK